MIITLDSNALIAAIDENSSQPIDFNGDKIPYGKERIRHFIKESEKKNIKVLIPTPVLAEVLSSTSINKEKILKYLTQSTAFVIASFDQRAALKNAEITSQALSDGDKKQGIDDPWQKVKFDRQIASIAAVHNSDDFYTTDKKLKKHAEKLGLPVKSIASMDLPPEIRQPKLELIPN